MKGGFNMFSYYGRDSTYNGYSIKIVAIFNFLNNLLTKGTFL